MSQFLLGTGRQWTFGASKPATSYISALSWLRRHRGLQNHQVRQRHREEGWLGGLLFCYASSASPAESAAIFLVEKALLVSSAMDALGAACKHKAPVAGVANGIRDRSNGPSSNAPRLIPAVSASILLSTVRADMFVIVIRFDQPPRSRDIPHTAITIVRVFACFQAITKTVLVAASHCSSNQFSANR